MAVFVACKINDFWNKLITMFNGLPHKVSDNVEVLFLPTVLVLDKKGGVLMSLKTKICSTFFCKRTFSFQLNHQI